MSSFAHDGQILSLKDHVYALPEGAYLFPLNGRVFDTTNEISILSNTSIYRDDEYKFQGSVAIEDGTRNEIQSITSAGGMDTNTPSSEKSPYPDEVVYHIAKGDWNGIQINPETSDSLGINETYSISCYAYIKEPCVAKFNLQLDSTEVLNQAKGRITIDAKSSGWYRLEWNKLSQSSSLTNVTFRIENCTSTSSATYNWSNGDNETWFTAVQFERVDHCSSFLPYATSRVSSQLEYDTLEIGIKSKGLASFWVYHNEYLYNAPSGNKHMINFHSSGGSTVRLYWGDGTLYFGTNDGTTWGAKSGMVSTSLAKNSWNNITIQWGVNGSTKEVYVNGKLDISDSGNLPTETLSSITLGHHNTDSSFITNTMYEQLVVHPSKTFTAQEIELMYKAQSPIYDWRDQILFW